MGCILPETAMSFWHRTRPTVLVLGFYDRGNAGDEMYKLAIPKLFGGKAATVNIIFKGMDDVKEIPPNVELVVCGGGDIINAYFMKKAEAIFANYTGRIYALSVGIPYASEARFLHLFDHVFVRSRNDFEIACNEIGSCNVTHLPDASFALLSPQQLENATTVATFKLGVALAQPAFSKNAAEQGLVDDVVGALHSLYQANRMLQVHLLTFNYSDETNNGESDYCVNAEVYARLLQLDPDFPVFFPRNLRNPAAIFERIKTMDVMLCMRYHSLLFSIMARKTVVAMFCTPKMRNAAQDYASWMLSSYELPVDAAGRPTSIDRQVLYQRLSDAFASVGPLGDRPPPLPPAVDWSVVKRTILDAKKRVQILVKSNVESMDHVLFNCRRYLMKYLDIPGTQYEKLLNRKGALDVRGHDPLNVARLVCYCITRSLASPYVWGLCENMRRDDFSLYEAIRYIWENHQKRFDEVIRPLGEQYYPFVNTPRRVFANLDFVFASDFKSYHRSGWTYAVGGMMNIDSHQLSREPKLVLDTYVDRSFHWGHDTLETLGIIPYRTAWMGFVHHTFDVTHSSFNCVELFKKTQFLESLKTCRGLVSLTQYLAKGLREALDRAGFRTVPVFVVYHPMETVELTFTMDRFISNPSRKVVQIGAWLRNSYAIYDLPLGKSKNNALKLQKAALRGKDMDHYFKPSSGFLERTWEFLSALSREDDQSQALICRPSICRPSNEAADANEINKYCAGLYDVIKRNDESVEIIERINNEDYDVMLSENIVFLNLVDCSAVNTVLECLVRNTPLVINRHPAVEEILGKGYPGFYDGADNLVGAMALLSDVKQISRMHTYIKGLDKRRYTLENFMTKLQDAILAAA